MPVREEHQAELAHDSIEGPIWIRQRLRRTLPPLDRRRQPLGHRQHAGSRIDSSNDTSCAYASYGVARQHASATRHVQNSITWLDPDGVKDAPRPLSKQRRHVQLLISRCSGDLILQVRIIHVLSPFSRLTRSAAARVQEITKKVSSSSTRFPKGSATPASRSRWAF
jgi:hypothetical protein